MIEFGSSGPLEICYVNGDGKLKNSIGTRIHLACQNCLATGEVIFTERDENGRHFVTVGRLDTPFIIYRRGSTILSTRIDCKKCRRRV